MSETQENASVHSLRAANGQQSENTHHFIGREVHKCGFLRLKQKSSATNATTNAAKYWVVFCVSNECEPNLEFYVERQPLNQRKNSHAVFNHSLKNCIHVSPSIVIDERENDFEFAITLDTQVLRLSAHTRELMDDWIDCIRNKLRQLKILCPKDNYYSKEPSLTFRRTSLPSVRPLPPIPSQQSSNNNDTHSSPNSSARDIESNGESSNHQNALSPNATNALYEPLFNSQRLASATSQLSTEVNSGDSLDRELASRGSLAASQQTQPLSLRESQVLKLQREISHKDGVRVMIRKKDSYESIALVDCLGSVFVAGWKQKQYPQLHNTFHIGDSVISICGQRIQSAAEAYRLIKQQPLIIEIIVQRVPFGKAFIIRRDYESQDLGIVRDGNSAEVIDIIPDSLADKCGISLKAPATNTRHGNECNWVITEINNRPLNLYFKGNEVKDRLNAIGRDISLLLQPSDFIKVIKKQLKSFKNYRDYIVQ
ncbi:hypothetical protein B4U79_10438 [Dinothrombium tinctorium]|uniref:PH domain-containing protein n=1 Tax=Dinothrombium tinctorium TaxID=1965070 RepID=A0A3S4R7B6_9ACAR|nr:hypothetical protein B4U79_00156 [Dinothrombium tinctorium]RWS11699.1 hypothetical protein B4U79_08512 [Dinothrombium tinctorium]RWS12525.1 hypothetical protein B4U79_10438 [Dinothrombium tinctorium]